MLSHLPAKLSKPAADIIVPASVGEGLGDCWATVNYYYHKAREFGRALPISRYNSCGVKVARIDEVLGAYLAGKEPLLRIVDVPANTVPDTYLELFHAERVPTTPSWLGLKSGIVVYQFDGRFEGKSKNPTPDQVNAWLGRMRAASFRPINLGNETPLVQAIALAAVAEFFVGIVSGMTEVCYAVGVPTHIVFNRVPEQYRRHYERRPFVFYDSLDDVLKRT